MGRVGLACRSSCPHKRAPAATAPTPTPRHRSSAPAAAAPQEAEAALASLDKPSLTELKSFGSPAAEIVQVLAACMVLCASGGVIPKDLRWAVLMEWSGRPRLAAVLCHGRRWVAMLAVSPRSGATLRPCPLSRTSAHPLPTHRSWNAGKKFMGNVDQFMRSLLTFDKDNVPGGWERGQDDRCLKSVRELQAPRSSPALMLLPACLARPAATRRGVRGPRGEGLCVQPQLQPRLHPHQVGGGRGPVRLGHQHLQVLPHLPGACGLWAGKRWAAEQPSCLGHWARALTCAQRPATPPLPPQVVAPKRAALAEANKRLEGANKKLSGIRARVKELQDRVAALEENLMKATEDKNNAVAQVGGRPRSECGRPACREVQGACTGQQQLLGS